MNLDALAETIETLKKRIEQHRQELSENETRTRAALINPLLHALGWDVADPALVKLEYSIGKKFADYALMKPDGKPAALLEAKKLGEKPDDHLDQMIGYAIKRGIKYAGIVNGDKWELYEVHKPNPIDENRILATSIVEDEPHACALELLALWRLNLASGNMKNANAPIIVVHEEEVEEKNTNPPEDPEPTPEPPIEPTPDGNWISLSEYHPPGGTAHPSAIRFPDGSEVELNRWYGVLIECAKWLHSNEHLTCSNMPAPTSSGRSFVANSEPITHTGRRMSKAEKIADGVYVSRHGSAEQHLNAAVSLLQHCDVDPSQIYLNTAKVDERQSFKQSEQPAQKPTPQPTPEPPTKEGWEPLSHCDSSGKTSKPSAIRFPDGSEHDLKQRVRGGWISILVTSAEWLCQTERLTDKNMPVPCPSGSRYIVNDSTFHRDGKPMNSAESVYNGRYFVEKNFSSKSTLDNTRALLAHCGIDSAGVHLQIKQSDNREAGSLT